MLHIITGDLSVLLESSNFRFYGELFIDPSHIIHALHTIIS